MVRNDLSLREIRAKTNLSQKDLSRLSGISQDKISKYERGVYQFTNKERELVEKVLRQPQTDIHQMLLEKTPQLSHDTVESYEEAGHNIYHGDAVTVLSQEIDNNSVDLIFVDPPYNIGKRFEEKLWETDEEYLDWCYSWIDLCIEKLSGTGSMYIMAATQFMPFIDIYIRDKMTVLSRIIWYYDSSGRQAKNYFGSRYEPVLHLVMNKHEYVFNSKDILVEAKTGAKRNLIDYRKDPPQPYNTTKVPGNVWQIPRVRYRMKEYEKHPSQKPEKLLERIILASSNEGDVVLDPFAGTFTTSAVAKRLKRRSIGIEINSRYVEIGLQRLNLKSNA